jgi:predicted transposase YbfD/YdcC
MDTMANGVIVHFSILPDPRVQKRSKHKLVDILVIAICAVISGAQGWEDIEEYGNAKIDWFKTFLELPHGIPSHDTFARVFSILDPLWFSRCFASWAETMRENVKESVIAIDGKTLRRSFDTVTGRSAIHMVSAWMVGNQVILGQVKVDEKSNEITAVPKLIDMLSVQGSTLTMDAMNCQKEIAQKIVDKGADYVFSLKGNHSAIHSEVKEFFEDCATNSFRDVSHDYFETTDKGHGRIEIRRYWQTADIGWLEEKGNWKGLRSIAMVQAVRITGENTAVETRYFLSSKEPNAQKLSHAVRGHWEIENGLHWCLDVAMGEDDCRIRIQNATENFVVLRHIALNLLKQEKSKKRGLKAKSKIACWDNNYLLKVLWG